MTRRKPKAIVIDDHQEVRGVISDMLEEAGFRVEAHENLPENKKDYNDVNVVFLDVLLKRFLAKEEKC